MLAALFCGGGIALGNWQSGRAADKRALGEKLQAALLAAPIEIAAAPMSMEAVAAKRVTARGVFLPERSVLLDNKIHGGRVGYEVVTPLRLSGSALHVLVNRGWIAAGPRRDALPQVGTPAGTVRIDGLAQERLPQAMSAGPEQGPVRQNLELAAYARESGLALQPFFVQQLDGPDDGLVRDWVRPEAGIDKHRAYALQWYSLAALAVVLALVFSFKRVA